MSIKAVVFDYGGVICTPPPAETALEMERLTGLSFSQMDELNRRYRWKYDRGAFNGEEYFRQILSRAGVFLDEESVKKIVQTDMDGYKYLNPGTIKLMTELKTGGVKTAILSNIPVDFIPWIRERLNTFGGVDAAIFSCEHHLLKPETAIFEKLSEELQLAYEELVYFDDLPENIIRACELGINGFVWINPTDARRTLKKTDEAFAFL